MALAPADPLAARALALAVLLAVERENAHADVSLAAALARSDLPACDRALASRLVYGTLAWQGRLDWQLARLAGRDPATLDPEIRAVLRLGLHQLTLLDRIPDHAAVATSVDLAKRHVPAASGLVNAVLRRATRERARLPLPDPAGDPLEHLAVACSHPRWLVEEWRTRFPPDELRALLVADNEAAPTVLRARHGERDALAARLADAGVASTPGRFSPDALRIDAAADPHELSGWSTGGFSIQGEASQLVAHLLGPRPDMRVLDACAAPGGKTTALAEIMGDRGLIVALDHRRRGARAIARNAARLRLRSVAAVTLDARTAGAAFPAARFDRILVDAPCSGFGTLRSHPEIRWRRTPADLDRLAAHQGALLAALTPLVAPGGAIVYATCTLSARENEGVVDDWLAAHPELVRESAADHLPESARALVASDGALRTYPHRDDLDGFYAVRARRR